MTITLQLRRPNVIAQDVEFGRCLERPDATATIYPVRDHGRIEYVFDVRTDDDEIAALFALLFEREIIDDDDPPRRDG